MGGISYVSTKCDGMLSEIEKNNPDVVVMDLDLYEKMDGIETNVIVLTFLLCMCEM